MSVRRNPVPKSGSISAGRGASFTATQAKNDFGRLLERAIQGDTVVITKHDSPRAVMISMEEYKALKGATERALSTLAAEFDSMYDRMQTPKSRSAMQAGFTSNSEQMGKAAVNSARKRG
jgi:antitoxin Phd